MLSKSNYFYLFGFIFLLALVWFGLSKRRDLPFQEIVPLDGGIAVINAGKWYNSNMSVTLLEPNGKSQKRKFNENGICLFDKLSSDKEYTIRIGRTDIKGMLLYKTQKILVSPKTVGSRYIVLIGASIGYNWDFPGLVRRIDLNRNIVLGFRAVFQFDKEKEIEILKSIPSIVNAVIIKQCAAYFPRDLEQSKKDVMNWVLMLQESEIDPVLATVVPITDHLDKEIPGKLNSILEYNDFIRKYAKKNKIKVLDLEKALRINENDRHLRDEYAQPDGYHLLHNAYEKELDKLAQTLLLSM